MVIVCSIFAAALMAAAFVWWKLRCRKYEFMSFMESINLTDLPVVTFIVQGKKLNFLLDTGCTLSIINQKVASEIEIQKTNAKTTIFGMEGNDVKCEMGFLNLEYKNSLYADYFQIVDMERSFQKVKQESGVTIHGILGTGFFQRYKSVLNFEEMKAYFKK